MGERTTLTLGPFLGGLNNTAFATGGTPTKNIDSIADNELVSCKDFDYLVDGTLQTRPPAGAEATTGNATFDTTAIKFLGFYVDPITDVSYAIVIGPGGDLYYRTGFTTLIPASTSAWTLIGNIPGTAAAGIQYNDRFYIIRSSTVGGRYWSPALGLNAVASMPAGNSLQVFKERLWATGVETAAATSSRLHYSNVGTGDTWTGADFIDISYNDGQRLITCYAGPSAIYLFKSNSTYVLTFDALPERGSVQQISSNVGILNAECYTPYENALFVVHGESLYRLDGYEYTKVNQKVNFASGVSSLLFTKVTTLSTVGNRIILQNKYLNYIYYPSLNVWTEWTLSISGRWHLVPNSFRVLGYGLYISPRNSGFPASASAITAIQDGASIQGQPENEAVIFPEIKTKMFNLSSSTFKKLHWWGVDAIISAGPSNTVLSLNVVLNSGATVNTLYTITDSDNTEKFFKGLRALRFTRIQFHIVLNSYLFAVGPSVISEITANISSNQSPIHRSPV